MGPHTYSLSLNPPMGVVGGGFSGVGDGLLRRSGGLGRLGGPVWAGLAVLGSVGSGTGRFGARGAGGGPLGSG